MKISVADVRTWLSLTLGRTQTADHGRRRYVRIVQSVLTAVAGRGIALVVGIISVPLTVGYLGTERYGVWVTISTLLAWLNIADLGLGNGLLNMLSKAYADDRPDLAQRYIATAFWMLIALALGLGLVWLGLGHLIDWSTVLRIQSERAQAEVAP